MKKQRIKAKVADLILNEGQLPWLPENPRQWTRDDLELTKASLLRDPDFQEDNPIKVVAAPDGKLLVFAGNLRTSAAREVKWDTFEAMLYTPEGQEDEETIRRRALLDNGSFGSWDYDRLADKWNEMPFKELGIKVWDAPLEETPAPVQAKEDNFDADADAIAVRCKPGDVWELGRHRLMCGDSIDLEQIKTLMGGCKADMAFTDPPYGVEYTGGIQFKADGYVEHNNRKMIANDDKDIYASVFPMLAEFVAGPCYVFFAGTKAASLYAAAEKYGEIHALLIWVKNGGYGALMANYKQKHEPCLYWKPKNAKLNFVGPTTETTIWEIDKDGVNEFHPTQKPVALAAKAMANHTAESVLDLFGGSGSTLIAAEQLGRKCYMMEIDPHYCDVIIARWEKLTGQTARKID